MMRTTSRISLVITLLIILSATFHDVSTASSQNRIAEIKFDESGIRILENLNNVAVEEEPAGECFSLDIIFLVDQSSSMGRVQGGQPNDPTDQRSYAPRWAVDWLADNALDICPETIHRMAVISYGSDAKIDLELSEIAPNSMEDSSKLRTNLKTNISAQDLGETDPRLAFDLAIQILENSYPPAGEGLRKRVIIFITDGEPCIRSLGCNQGDNRMDFYKYTEDLRDDIATKLPFDPTLLSQEKCLKDLAEEYEDEDIPAEETNACLEKYRVSENAYQNSTYIWTILLRKGSAYNRALRDIFLDISESHGGTVIDLKENRQEIPNTFLKIMTQLAGVRSQPLKCGNFAVNPYLRQARLTFFKISEETEVRLSYTDVFGNVHHLFDGEHNGGFEVAEHYSEGANERYVLAFPYPGIWRFESDACDGIDAYYEPLSLNVGGTSPLVILTPDRKTVPPESSFDSNVLGIPMVAQPPYYDEQEPFKLAYILHDETGRVVKEADNSFFGVQFDLKVTDPKGVSAFYSMEWNAQENRYESSAPLQLPHIGEYSIQLTGSVWYREYPYGPVDSQANLGDVFTSNKQMFVYQAKLNVICPGLDLVSRCPWPPVATPDGCTVCEKKGYGFSILQPEQNQMIGSVHSSILRGWPLKVEPFEIMVELDWQMKELINLEQVLNNSEQPFKMILSAGDVTQELSYRHDPQSPGRYLATVENFEVEGDYLLTIELTSGFSEFYAGPVASQTRGFSRADNVWTRPATYRLLLAVLIVACILFILRQWAIRNNKVSGTLIFKDGNTVIKEFPLNSGKNWKEVNPKLLKKYPQLDLDSLRVSSTAHSKGIGGKKRRKGLEGDEYSNLSSILDQGLGSGGPSCVRVTGKTRSRRRLNMLVEANLPTTYSENSVAAMIYEPRQ